MKCHFEQEKKKSKISTAGKKTIQKCIDAYLLANMTKAVDKDIIKETDGNKQ